MIYNGEQNRYRTGIRGFTITEMMVAAALALLLLVIVVPAVRRNREMAQENGKTAIATHLRRIESAKSAYVADKGKQTGDTITLHDLLQGGYLNADPHEVTGAIFDAGVVGEAPTYRFGSSHHH